MFNRIFFFIKQAVGKIFCLASDIFCGDMLMTFQLVTSWKTNSEILSGFVHILELCVEQHPL